MDYRSLYKIKPFRFQNIQNRRVEEANKIKVERQARRTHTFNQHRNIVTDNCDKLKNKTEHKFQRGSIQDRKLALKKFIEEKETNKTELKRKKRPPFKVGIVQHGSSPVLRNLPNSVSKIVIPGGKESAGKTAFKTTNSPEPFFQLKHKKSFKFETPCAGSLKKLTSPYTPEVLKRSLRKYKPTVILKSKETKCSQPESQTSTISGGGEELAVPLYNSQIKPDNNIQTLKHLNVQFGLNVKLHKHNVTKYIKKEPTTYPGSSSGRVYNMATNYRPKKESCDTDKTSSAVSASTSAESSVGEVVKENQYHNQPIQIKSRRQSCPEEKLGLQKLNTLQGKGCVHRSQLEEETQKLLALADEWDSVTLDRHIPEEVLENIYSVVGHTRLLVRDKFKQFLGLIEQYEHQDDQDACSRPITINDLDGFWDLVYLQVKSLNDRFMDLQTLKGNNWSRPVSELKKKERKKINKPKPRLFPNKDEQYSTNEGLLDKAVDINIKLKPCFKDEPIPYESRNDLVGSSSHKRQTSPDSLATDVTMPPLRQSAAWSFENKSDGTMEICHNKTSQINSTKKSVSFKETLTEESSYTHIATPMPRRSSRLIGKSVTPKNCHCCNSPVCEKGDRSKPNKDDMHTPKGRFLLLNSTSGPKTFYPKKPPNSGNKKVLFKETEAEESNYEHIGTPMPRRSLRLSGKSPTPKNCQTCNSPACKEGASSKPNECNDVHTPRGCLKLFNSTPKVSSSRYIPSHKSKLQLEEKEENNDQCVSKKKCEEKSSYINVYPPATYNLSRMRQRICQTKSDNDRFCNQDSLTKKVPASSSLLCSNKQIKSRKVSFHSEAKDKMSSKLSVTPFKRLSALDHSRSPPNVSRVTRRRKTNRNLI